MDENLEVRLTLDFLVGLATLPDDFGSGFYEQDGLRLCYEFLDYRKRINVRILGQVISVSQLYCSNVISPPANHTDYGSVCSCWPTF